MNDIIHKFPHIFSNEFNERFIRLNFKHNGDFIFILKDENYRLDIIKQTKDGYEILNKKEIEFWEMLSYGQNEIKKNKTDIGS
jgi:hypothetical protein